MGNWLQVSGECAERLSASVAPEHLRGSWQPGSIRCGAVDYRPQVPGECEERISDSVAPEHLRGTKRLRSDLPAAGGG